MSSASTKNYIDFKNMDGFVQTMVIAKIEEVLKIAGKHGGHVYGGYVRGVLVPRSKDPKCPVSFKDVDLWFQTKEQADAFVQEMGSAFVDHKHHFESTIKYAFDRQTYHYYVHETCVAWFDIVISKVFPVNDFDVNCLTFLFDGEETRKCVWTVRSSIETIEQHILAKEARLLEEPNEDNEPLIRRLVKSQGENILTPITTRFKERYAKQGWKIMLGDQLCSFEGYEKAQIFLKQVLQYLQPSPPVPCAAEETVVSSDTVDPASVLPPVSSAEEDPVSEEPAYSASDFCCRTNWFSGTCVHSCAKKEEPAASVPTESVDPASTLPPVSSAEEDTLPPLEPMASDEESAISIYVNAPEINDSVHLKVRIPIDRTSDASYIPVSIYVVNKNAPSAPPAAAPAPASAKEEEPAASPSDKIIKDKDSSTPLYSAYVAVDKEMVKVLLEPVNRFVIDKVNDQFQVRGRHCIRSRQIVSLTPSEVEKAKQLGFQVPSANMSQKLKDLKVMLRLASLASQLESTIGPVSRVESYRDFIRLGLVESGRRPSIHGRRPSILPARFWY